MIQIEAIRHLPEWKWMPKSQQEMLLTGDGLVELTDFMYKVGQVAVVGLIYNSLLCPPWMWFALADGITIRDLVDFRRLARMIPQGTLTAVESEFTTGLRFAKLYGFVETDAETNLSGHDYKIMRKA